MKKIVIAVLLGVSLFNPSSVLAADIEDGFMRGIFQYLAKRRSMNLVAYSGEKVAEIGRLYYVEEPDTPGKLKNWASHGKEIKLFEYSVGYNLSEHVEYQKEESYQIQKQYADYLAAELKARLKEQGVELEAFKKALGKAQIRFTVYRKVVEARLVSNAVQADKQNIIKEFDAFEQGEGLLIPFQQLVITDFSYNEDAASELNALLGYELLKTVKAKLSANMIKTQDAKVDLPASSTIAFKAFPVYFKPTHFFGMWF
ncbi:MAG TPA: hypothetical protein VFK23_12375 [Nitrospirota bacterium]|nr:hypothetical protein [Nitrospirota bacterium]